MTSTNQLFQRAKAGDTNAQRAFISRIYKDLQKIASNQLRKEYKYKSLCTEDLLHNWYLKLRKLSWQKLEGGRTGLIKLASTMISRILIDRARKKHGHGPNKSKFRREEPLQEEALENTLNLEELPLYVKEGLKRLSPRQKKVFLMRVVGLKLKEIAHELKSNTTTAHRLEKDALTKLDLKEPATIRYTKK